jgi:hypothetical protein
LSRATAAQAACLAGALRVAMIASMSPYSIASSKVLILPLRDRHCVASLGLDLVNLGAGGDLLNALLELRAGVAVFDRVQVGSR